MQLVSDAASSARIGDGRRAALGTSRHPHREPDRPTQTMARRLVTGRRASRTR